MQAIDQLLDQFDGDDEVMIHVPMNGGRVSLRSRKHRVDWSDALAQALGDIIGSDQVDVEKPRLAS